MLDISRMLWQISSNLSQIIDLRLRQIWLTFLTWPEIQYRHWPPLRIPPPEDTLWFCADYFFFLSFFFGRRYLQNALTDFLQIFRGSYPRCMCCLYSFWSWSVQRVQSPVPPIAVFSTFEAKLLIYSHWIILKLWHTGCWWSITSVYSFWSGSVQKVQSPVPPIAVFSTFYLFFNFKFFV